MRGWFWCFRGLLVFCAARSSGFLERSGIVGFGFDVQVGGWGVVALSEDYVAMIQNLGLTCTLDF